MTDPRRINADLHCHSVVSDGTLEPHAVVERAHRNGVELLALTDHDEVAGQAEAMRRASELGLAIVPGVEVSVTWAHETVHIVGLRIDPKDPTLIAGLDATRNGRDARAREISEQLALVGIRDAYRGALRHAGNPELISRSHFARYIIEIGAAADIGDVFRKYLIEGKPGFVPHRWARLGDAIGWIRGAGGVAVLAHPGRYRLSDLCFDEMVQEFREHGGTGIEVVSGSHTPAQYIEFEAVARRYGLDASRGSDFHSPGESRHDLGSLPRLPPTLEPVWRDWPEIAGRALQ
jgi:3',5'-nucleoside bisphosphate phosphatase